MGNAADGVAAIVCEGDASDIGGNAAIAGGVGIGRASPTSATIAS
jgi:hypothetical protein